jgi:formate dehydrogenase iron-sulfur subunit
MQNEGLQTPVDRVLHEQQSLTAVERFARWHEPDAPPAQHRYYKELIPLSKPGPGQQYCFEVDLDRCSGCQACVTACHSLNGLDDHESWREIGLLFSDDARAPYQATVTTACHHCIDPGCLTGCPVLAYDKDPVTGIVRHLDDQCIGCQYCVMKCPYEVPQYSASRGIVRKCDMCSSRLEHGEAPACVQACPSQAIRIAVVEKADLIDAHRNARTGAFLPTAPSPIHTVPTTRYVSAQPVPEGLVAGDRSRVAPADPHMPLVFMLVLSQLAAGTAVAALFPGHSRIFAVTTAASGAVAMGLATLHLGRPLKAWRSFLGWRTSWFSREVIAFGAFIPLAAMSASSFWLLPVGPLREWLVASAAAAGLVGVGCSAMIYVDTRRDFWSPSRSFGRFLGTTLVLGLAVSLAVCAASAATPTGVVAALAAATGISMSAKLVLEQRIQRHQPGEDRHATTQLARSAQLLTGPLGLVSRIRVFCGCAGGLALPAAVGLSRAAGIGNAMALAIGALALCVGGELLERYLFFTAVAPDRMPGSRSA